MKKIVVAISGASGAIYGIRLLEALREAGKESHLILSDWAKKTIEMETDYTVEEVIALASYHHSLNDLGASLSSGSFQHQGMVIAPCSMKTLAGIAQGLELNLIIRAASVTLKEQRKLILLPRETPLTSIHLENMLTLTRLGVVMMPPVPALYNRPASLDQVVNHTVARVLDHLNIPNELTQRWS
ncbi:MAG: UbiX family flavin prenyltransferase [Clostridiales bacterium]